MIEHIETPTVYLPGHDQGEPRPATEGSAGHDLPAILTRACQTVDERRFFNWQGHRHDAWKMPPESKQPRIEFDNIAQWLQNVRPGEVQKIKGLNKFPFQHLHLKIHPGETILVPLGIKAAVSEDKVCYLYPRASSAKKRYVLANDVGVIDPDYPDEWFAAVLNVGKDVLVFQHGQRIVQAVFGPRIMSTFPKHSQLPQRGDRSGGFGSTGTGTLPQPAPTPPPQPQPAPDPAPAPQQAAPTSPATDPMEVLDGEMTPQEAAGLAQQAGETMPAALNEALNGGDAPVYDEPEPDTAAAAAVRDMIGEADPAEDAALDRAIAAEDARLMAGVDPAMDASDPMPPEPAPAPPQQAPTASNEYEPVYLVCGNVRVGPVAKFRPTVHGPMYNADGADPVAGVLMREITSLGPKALPKLVEALMQQSVAGDNPAPQEGGAPA